MTYPPPDPNRGIRTAGTAAIWVWVVLGLSPLVVCILCMVLTALTGIFGADKPR